MIEKDIEKSSKGTGRTFIRALALFAMLCGGILLLVGHRGSELTGKGAPKNEDSVLNDLNAATNALEDKNYGRARYHLRAARKRLNFSNE